MASIKRYYPNCGAKVFGGHRSKILRQWCHTRMIEIVLGSCLLALALLPGAKFYPGRLGTRQLLPPIEPAWIMRLFFLGIGLGELVEGLRTVLHR
jgi:hypothetical protein